MPIKILATFIIIYLSMSKLCAQDDSVFVGINPLMEAVVNNDNDSLRFFAKIHPEMVNKKNIGGAAAINIAARNGRDEMVRILIENSADINSTDNESWTPIMRASLGYPKIVELLISKKAKILNVNSNNDSAISISANSGCFGCLKLIMDSLEFTEENINLIRSETSKAYIASLNKEKNDQKAYLNDYTKKISDFIKKRPNKDHENESSKDQYSTKRDIEDGKIYILKSSKDKVLDDQGKISDEKYILLKVDSDQSNKAVEKKSDISEIMPENGVIYLLKKYE